MDNVREKLVELLKDPPCNTADEEDCANCKYHPEYFCSEEMMADILIANGVMFQRYAQWKDVTKIGSFCYAYCSNCCTEHKAPNYAALAVQHRFCRWCGARMVHYPPKGDSV